MKNSTKMLVLSSIVSGFAFGQNRYVSTTGNDATNDCSSVGSPCKTISAAAMASLSGDSIIVASGTYSLSGTLGLTKSDITLIAADATSKPIITSTASDVMNVSAANVSIENFVFNMGLTSSTGMRGIVGFTGFDGLNVSGNEFYSTNAGGMMSTGMVFGSYAMVLYAPSTESPSISINNNVVGIASVGNDVFGRGLGIGFNASGTRGPGGVIANNDIAAFYPIQGILIAQDIDISNNNFKGLTMINATTNGATVSLDSNVFDAVSDQYAANIYTLLDIRATNTGNVTVSNNSFLGFLTTGVFSMASRNVSVIGNTFTPSSTANQFISIMANTKLQTSGTQGNTYSDGMIIKGNTFNPGVANTGTGIVFADHYGVNTPAFDTIVIGGSDPVDYNIFNENLGYFIQLDSLSGSSDQVPMWNPSGFSGDHTPATTMKPVSQNVIALATNNSYHFSTVAEIEAKNIDSLDVDGLGKIILGYVSPAGITQNKVVSATLYPNPVSDNLNIVLNEGADEATVQIIDVLGNVVFSGDIQSKGAVNVSSFNAGVYFVRLTSNNQTYSTRIIKR